MKLLRNKRIVTGILAAVNVGLIIFYTICSDACLYVRGSILGLDMKYAGLLFMAVLLILLLMKKDVLSLALLSLGVGAEIFLVSFQIRNTTYCPYCLAFGALLLVMFAINFHKKQLWIMALSALLGLLFFLFAFNGSVRPVYAGENMLTSFGSGPVTVRLYTDYFCGPCRAAEPSIEAILRDLMRKNAIHLTLVDTPVHKDTPLYARFFLYLLHDGEQSFSRAFALRDVLFEAAAQNITTPAGLEDFLAKKGLKFEPFDVMPDLQTMNGYIREDNIRSTPSCVIIIPRGKQVYVGGQNIVQALKAIIHSPKGHVSEKKPHERSPGKSEKK